MYQTLKDLNLQPGDVVEHRHNPGYTYTVNSAGLLCHDTPLFSLSSEYQKGGCYYVSSVNWKLISRAPRSQPWGQLPDKEKVELLLAHQRGEVIEVSCSGGVLGRWVEAAKPAWFASHYYRIKTESPPLPVVKKIVQPWKTNAKGEFQPMSTDPSHATTGATHKVTFTVTDGQPDCNSIRMEKLAT